MKARLDVSQEEAQVIVKNSLGGLELAKLPNSMGSNFAQVPLYLGEMLNRDWEHKCKTSEDAEIAELEIIEACKGLKVRMTEVAGDSGTKTIEL